MWAFDEKGPRFSGLSGPLLLVRGRMGLPTTPGYYLVTCGDCLAHVGETGRGVSGRLGQLANARRHGGLNEVLCAAFCTGQPPQVWWEECSSKLSAERHQKAFKDHYGEPPFPPKYESCRRGERLRRELVKAAGKGSWEAGYIEAIFDSTSGFGLLLKPRFEFIWDQVGRPPGPWWTATENRRKSDSHWRALRD